MRLGRVRDANIAWTNDGPTNQLVDRHGGAKTEYETPFINFLVLKFIDQSFHVQSSFTTVICKQLKDQNQNC